MRLTKKFVAGLTAQYIGIPLAFTCLGHYELKSIILFWVGIVIAASGLILIAKGVEPVDKASDSQS